jgi:hypothetical protein
MDRGRRVHVHNLATRLIFVSLYSTVVLKSRTQNIQELLQRLGYLEKCAEVEQLTVKDLGIDLASVSEID